MSPAPYDYSSASGYARARPDWADFPSTSTPIQQSHLDRIEQALFDMKATIKNVRDFGAAGDGSTDDTTAINNALAAAAGGGTVLFPVGNYKVTSAIVIPRNSQKGLWISGAGAGLPGSGAGHTTITYSGSGYCFTFGNGSTSDYAEYQWISDMKINMSASGTPTGGVRFNSALFCEMRNVSILGPTGGSKILVYFDPGDGTYGNYHNVVYHCALQGSTQANDIGVKLHSTTGTGANSNLVRDGWLGILNQGVLVDGCDSNRISGNEFNVTNTGVKVQATTGAADATCIYDNRFDGGTTSVDIAASCNGTIVTLNTGTTAYVNNGATTYEMFNVNAVWTGSGTFLEYTGAAVTAASSIALSQPGERVQRVDGTANITGITGGRAGQVLTLYFTGTASGTGLTDGSNLKLAGNFVYTPDDTITLFTTDGTVYYELSRSVN